METLDTWPSDTNSNFINWTSKFTAVFDKHVPGRHKIVKKETQPDWLNVDIQFAMNQHDFNVARSGASINTCETKLLRASKKNFFSQSIAENKDNTFRWRHIKSLNGQNEGTKIPDEVNIDGNTFKQKHEVIQQLNYFFSSISKRLKSDDSQTNDINEYDFTKLKDYVDSKVPNEINFKIPSMKDAKLTNALESQNTKKSTGLDGLSPIILSARIIGPSLLKMINYSINSGIFPDNLKIARLIIPIHKGGQKDDPSNFRPISFLTVISKLLEKNILPNIYLPN